MSPPLYGGVSNDKLIFKTTTLLVPFPPPPKFSFDNFLLHFSECLQQVGNLGVIFLVPCRKVRLFLLQFLM